MILAPLDDSEVIDKIARDILVGSGAIGKFPTPIDDIIAYTGLSIANGIDLSHPEAEFLNLTKGFFGTISRKVLGMIDLRDKIIYLDQSQPKPRKNFVSLHEVGHGVLPWQRDLMGCLDDETTLGPEIEELYERQASYFASSSLFQLDRFEEEAVRLPLSIASARALGQMFGGSFQAALRRYVERSPERCALLVLRKPARKGVYRAVIGNYFESRSFRRSFGGLLWPAECGLRFEFVKDMKRGRRDHQNGQIGCTTRDLDPLTLNYDFFYNSYNFFVLLYPPGENNFPLPRIII